MTVGGWVCPGFSVCETVRRSHSKLVSTLNCGWLTASSWPGETLGTPLINLVTLATPRWWSPTSFATRAETWGGPDKVSRVNLTHTLANLLDDMRLRAQLSLSVCERISATRDVVLFALAVYTLRRGFDLFFRWGLKCCRCRMARVLFLSFHVGKTLLTSTESVVVSADQDNYQTCAVQTVSAYIAAAHGMGWNLALDH